MIEAVLWLVINLYHEARGEPVEAQIAVVQVCLRRAKWKPENVPSVVQRPYQFSWTADRLKLTEARRLVRETRVPGRMKKFVRDVYRAMAVPFYKRPVWTHYQVPGASK
ncbi:MAG: cell wall hydrolase, partial [candidate division Zixibacteria bacterium]|nr:cell wall hydrolase [Phycisphaerae bacterium]NIS16342.1 cell wall hydrolase [candidate division Zixibacteria bacterium]